MSIERVFVFETSGPALLTKEGLDTPGGPRIGWLDHLPSSGYWKVGDKLTVGTDGWVCVRDGVPGLWASTTPPEGGVVKGRVTYSPPSLIFKTGIIESVTFDPGYPGDFTINMNVSFQAAYLYQVSCNGLDYENAVCSVVQKYANRFRIITTLGGGRANLGCDIVVFAQSGDIVSALPG